MTRRKVIHWKGVFMGMASLALIFCAHVLLTLFALPITPVEYEAPPDFARHVVPSAAAQPADTVEHELTPAAPAPASPAGEEMELLAKGVLFEGQPPDQFLALFSHPDQAVRMAAARALALCWSANRGMAEPRAEGHEELMRRYEFERDFWANADKPVVLNALLEAVSTSFERGEGELRADDYQVLYLLSGSWGQSAQRAEILAWVANHHPSDDMRLSAMFFLVNRGREFAREIGDDVLDSRASDPSFRVRFEAWKQRVQRIF